MYSIGTCAWSREISVNSMEANMKVFIVVEVACGVAQGTRCFRRIEDAMTCRKRLRRGRNLEEDDIQLFECVLDDISQRQSDRNKGGR
jgi:hypothetical protein